MLDTYINGDPAYINVEIPLGTVPTILALYPIVYYIPTVYITFKILSICYRILSKKENTIDPLIMLIIVLHQVSATCLLISDYMNFRIPMTGLMTNWCASQPPNHFLKIYFWTSIYFYFLNMMFPFLLAALRLVPIYWPIRHLKINTNIIRIGLPIILLYPIASSFFLFPALGVCRQHPPPYGFGAIHVHFIESWRGIRNSQVLIVNLILWLTLAVTANLMLYCNVRKVNGSSNSKKFHKSEKSLTLTTISMLFSFFANIVYLIAVQFFNNWANYLVAVRSLGGDFDVVVIPWIFFLIHPVFRRRQEVIRIEAVKKTSHLIVSG